MSEAQNHFKWAIYFQTDIDLLYTLRTVLYDHIHIELCQYPSERVESQDNYTRHVFKVIGLHNYYHSPRIQINPTDCDPGTDFVIDLTFFLFNFSHIHFHHIRLSLTTGGNWSCPRIPMQVVSSKDQFSSCQCMSSTGSTSGHLSLLLSSVSWPYAIENFRALRAFGCCMQFHGEKSCAAIKVDIERSCDE